MSASAKQPTDTIRIHPDVCGHILNIANRGLPRMEFLQEVAKMLVSFIGCDSVEIRVVRGDKVWRSEESADSAPPLRQEIRTGRQDDAGRSMPALAEENDLEALCEMVFLGRLDPTSQWATPMGNFHTGNIEQVASHDIGRTASRKNVRLDGGIKSLVIIRFSIIADGDGGVLLLKSAKTEFFAAERVRTYEYVARILGIALNQRRAQIALRERIKELTCLYGVNHVAANPHLSLDEVLWGAVQLLPQGWLYTDVASAKIELDGRSYATDGFHETEFIQSTAIVINGQARGMVHVAYSKRLPELDEGPFLREEREFIELIARELALIIEAKQMESEREVLQEQLRHADRLATIGQLAAGVAHELNEPLASILGRAQLIEKTPKLPPKVRRDSEKIVTASLHAREVVSKLRLFARHSPARREAVNLNDIVRDGLELLSTRCANAGIDLVRSLDEQLPDIIADAGQLYQVLINLVVNALQATSDGGRITIRTRIRDREVALRVEDTGEGMDAETLKHIFTPFFTTKDVDQGTGLGLAVVHGIVTSHGGRIAVNSKPGRGTCFEIILPIRPRDKPLGPRE